MSNGKRELENRAWVVGGGSYVSLGRFNDAADKVAIKFEALHRNDPAASTPTVAELAELRERYLENEALSRRSETLWELAKNSGQGEITRFWALLIYRLVVFSAACMVLYRFISPDRF